MKIGYARVSTADQDLTVQIEALKQAGCERIYSDIASGAKTDRPGFGQALDYMREGDVLVVWRLDRLGRSLIHLIDMMALLEDRGIGFLSLKESMDTTTSGGRMIFRIFGAFAQFERDLISERTLAGLQAARAQGRRGGRPKALNDDQLQVAYQLYDDREHTVKQICEMLGISKPTLYSYLRQREQAFNKNSSPNPEPYK
jgi:DNA invertase Pin-like site-specific DNA recombinase